MHPSPLADCPSVARLRRIHTGFISRRYSKPRGWRIVQD
jgi:hypothetical protein